MFKNYKIEVDSKAFEKRLGNFKNKMPQVARRMMGKVSSEIRKESRSKYLRNKLIKKRSGDLYKKISYKTRSNFTAYITASAYYASVHETGATIAAKNGNYLTYLIGDQWRKSRELTIPARPFLWPVVNEFFTTNRASSIMDMVLQQQMTKLIEKENAKA